MILGGGYPGADHFAAPHYNYFRDYDPAIGRYVESDPLGLAAGLNTYAYVDSNALSGFDELGLANGGGHRPGALGTLNRTWREMKDKNVPGTDQFFHCLATCRSVKGGFSANDVLKWTEVKETRDSLTNSASLYGKRKLSPIEMLIDSNEDRHANQFGTQCQPSKGCNEHCSSFLDNLAPRHRPFMGPYRTRWP